MARNCWLNPKNKDKHPKWFDKEKHRCNSEVNVSSPDKMSDKSQLVNVHWGQYEEAFESDHEENEAENKHIEEEIVATQAQQEKKET